jgi:hypothetical protein
MAVRRCHEGGISAKQLAQNLDESSIRLCMPDHETITTPKLLPVRSFELLAIDRQKAESWAAEMMPTEAIQERNLEGIRPTMPEHLEMHIAPDEATNKRESP